MCSGRKKFGQEAVEDTETTRDPIKAIEILNQALKDRGIVWDFHPFPGDSENPVEERAGKQSMHIQGKEV